LVPLIIMAIIAFPMTFFAHRGLTRFVLSGKNPGEDITEVVEEHFGVGAGKLITLLYFFAIYPILLVYSVAITNTVESFMTAPVAHDATTACHSVSDPDRRYDDHRALR
jgi:serine transporter